MVLNCWLFPASPCGVGHDTRFEAADGGLSSATVCKQQ